ncbi:hypothetical protein B0H34DRAFT_674684 [Crassisporium funariophilum]|nr:hypothetical protein B0H34DRAFT_674684 [Crassisporium funariophilum]
MQVGSTPPVSQSYTILRIKRKRNEEPLEALVVESRVRRKKSRGGVGVFQYAQTVENADWDDAQRQKDIQAEISRLARETALKPSVPPVQAVPPSPTTRQPREEHTRRYTIIEHDQPVVPTRRFPTSPPKVLSSKEMETKKSVDFKMYDAIPTTQPSVPEKEDAEMDKFLPMLNDYLKINHDEASTSTSAPVLKKPSNVGSSRTVPPATTAEGDYVWDVFYHRPATLSEWNEAANVGTLTGLPPSFGAVYDSASDSEEEEDEADEDSNAEEYYKNDYPDEMDSSGSSGFCVISYFQDEFHEESDYDDMMHYRNPAQNF